MRDIQSCQKSHIVTINIAEHLLHSVGFKRLYDSGMALVQKASAYLDGEGRLVSKDFTAELSLCYATESMKLTTRLIQASSWLLLYRAVAEDELTKEEALQAKQRVDLEDIVGDEAFIAIFDQLPENFRDLIAQSFRLQHCIMHMDQQLQNANSFAFDAATTLHHDSQGATDMPYGEYGYNDNPVAQPLDILRNAFG